jgi:uncharacterized membrane protein (UPF0127 family)
MARILATALLFFTLGAEARDLDKTYKKENFNIGKQAFTAWVADSDPKRAEGLMYVTKLPDDTGMLFVFDREQPLSFWMKNTLIPLSIGFLDTKGTLVDIQEMEPAKSMVQVDVPTYHSRKPARFALEMSKGWFAKRKVAVGAKLSPVPSGR